MGAPTPGNVAICALLLAGVVFASYLFVGLLTGAVAPW